MEHKYDEKFAILKQNHQCELQKIKINADKGGDELKYHHELQSTSLKVSLKKAQQKLRDKEGYIESLLQQIESDYKHSKKREKELQEVNN